MYRLLGFSLLLASYLNSQPITPLVDLAPIGQKLEIIYKNLSPTDDLKIWIYFKDKGPLEKQTNLNAKQHLTDRAIQRRLKVLPENKIVDGRDLPVYQEYINIVSTMLKKERQHSKWFNGISAIATKTQIESLRQLPFVREIEIVADYGKAKPEPIEEETESNDLFTVVDSLNYGTGRKQVDQINVIPLHNRGIRGQGVLVGVFDNGFRLLSHESFATMNIVASYDFVDNDPNPAPPPSAPSSYGAHGVNTLSTIGGYKAGQLIGPAYQANFLLARTENDAYERPIEEDNWVRAIEWAESLGVDVTSTSLGYLTYDSPYPSWTWQNMNGNTTLITRAANRADSLGIIVVNSAGNEASVGTPNTLIAPADGFNIITVGAVDSFGVRSSFSSYGPTSDGRTKPDVVAMGTSVKVASASNTTGYSRSSGTSFSCPLAAGVAAIVLSAHPSLTNNQVREALKRTASRNKNPDNYYGWGILNATTAADFYKPNIYHTPVSGIQLNMSITITAIVNSVISLKLDSCKVVYGINGLFTNFINLQPTGNLNEYSATIPPMGMSNIVNYYITIQNIDKDLAKSPTNAPIDFYTYTIGGTTTTQQLASGWNLVSIPLRLSDYQASAIFPSAASQVYGFQDIYIIQTTLQNNKGYWVKYNSNQSIELTGFPRLVDTAIVSTGWNLIGGLSNSVSVSSIVQEPPDIIESLVYGYNNSYEIANVIEPGKGYWVKVNQNGKLFLNSNNH